LTSPANLDILIVCPKNLKLHKWIGVALAIGLYGKMERKFGFLKKRLKIMTHDELLAEINIASIGEYASLAVALLAVVEIHKPYEHEVVSYVFCQGCTIDLDLAPPYPCETIEAIEKELG
jgi:hypothetical protein